MKNVLKIVAALAVIAGLGLYSLQFKAVESAKDPGYGAVVKPDYRDPGYGA